MAIHILFVCTGNTCRSPLAEVLARRYFAQNGWSDVEVSSAGTFALDGGSASSGSHAVARENGLDLESFVSRRLTKEVLGAADLVLVMEPDHRSGVLGLDPKADTKTHLLGELSGVTGEDATVPDPFGSSLESYRHAFRRIDRMIREGLGRIRELAGPDRANRS